MEIVPSIPHLSQLELYFFNNFMHNILVLPTPFQIMLKKMINELIFYEKFNVLTLFSFF